MKTMLALMFLLPLCINGLTHEIQAIKTNAGLYYEPLYQVRFTRTEWKLVTSIDIGSVNNLRYHMDLEDAINKTYADCLTRFAQFYCAEGLSLRVLNSKQIRLPALVEQIDSLLEYPQNSSEGIGKRSAPFGFVGTLSKTLFGTLNSDDAEYFNNQIDKLYWDQKKLTQVLANETHIVKSSLRSMQEQLFAEIRTTREYRKLLDEKLKRGDNKAYFIRLELLSDQMQMTINSYINTLETIIDAILFAKAGIIHPELITPKRMEHAIRTFIEHQRNYVFPIPIEEIHNGELEKISKISVTHHLDKLIVVIQVPLLEPAIYHLYQLHPYPTPQVIGNYSGSAYIQPRINYLILSKEKERYSLTRDISLPYCSKTHRHYICIPSYPLYDFAMQPICEVSLLGKTVQNPHEDCDIRISKVFHPYWKKLTQSKGWLYSLPDEETVQIICGDNTVKTHQLHGAGILYLDPGCIARTPHATMLGYQMIETNVKLDLDYIPTIPLNISKLIPGVEKYEQLSPVAMKKDPPRITTFANVPGSLSYDSTLSEIEQQLLEFGSHHRDRMTHQESLFYIIIAIGILAVLFLLYASRNAIIMAITKTFGLCSRPGDDDDKEEEMTTYKSAEVIYDTPRTRKRTLHFSFPTDAEPSMSNTPQAARLLKSDA